MQRALNDCRLIAHNLFSLASLRTSLSRIQSSLDILRDDLSLNAPCLIFYIAKNSFALWPKPLSPVKDTLPLYALCRQFVQQIIEQDRLSVV